MAEIKPVKNSEGDMVCTNIIRRPRDSAFGTKTYPLYVTLRQGGKFPYAINLWRIPRSDSYLYLTYDEAVAVQESLKVLIESDEETTNRRKKSKPVTPDLIKKWTGKWVKVYWFDSPSYEDNALEPYDLVGRLQIVQVLRETNDGHLLCLFDIESGQYEKEEDKQWLYMLEEGRPTIDLLINPDIADPKDSI